MSRIFPSPLTVASNPIHTFSPEATSNNIVTMWGGGVDSALNRNWLDGANQAFYFPFALPTVIKVTKLWHVNGTTPAGNLDLGIYGSSFRRIISTGAVAQSGADVIQSFDIDDIAIGPGWFWMGISASSAVSQSWGVTPNDRFVRAMGCKAQSSAHPLPALAVPNIGLSATMPIFGLLHDGRTVI
jgi:hypothetical protein